MIDSRRLEARFERILRAFDSDPAAPCGNMSVLGALGRWGARVVEWNQRIDLTAARSDDELVDLLLADAAAVAKFGRASLRGRCVDVGSGAGGPGLALALLANQLELTLVEPKAKRVAFLRSVVGELGRADLRVQRARSDEVASGSFDVAISRATFAPAEWLTEGGRLALSRVWVLLAQGDAPESPDFELELDQRYVWPLTGAPRRVLMYVRRGSTDAQPF